jgi:hypothetical protein
LAEANQKIGLYQSYVQRSGKHLERLGLKAAQEIAEQRKGNEDVPTIKSTRAPRFFTMCAPV